MNERYHHPLVAAGIDVTYRVHTGGHDIFDFLGEINAMLRWGLFKPVVTGPMFWVNQTVATSGQLSDFDYRIARPPEEVVRCKQSGTTLSISAAGSAVTLTIGTGCAVHTPTPAMVQSPNRDVMSPREPTTVGPRACR